MAQVTWQSVTFKLKADADAWADPDGELSRYVTRQRKYNIEAMQLEGTYIQFVGTTDIIGAAKAARLYPEQQHIYNWMRVPSVGGRFPAGLDANITAVMGCVNNAPFDGGRFATGTLLCGAPEIVEQLGPNGVIEYDVKYLLAFRPDQGGNGGWNVKFKVGTGAGTGWQPVEIGNTGGLKPYPSADFKKLFKLA